MFALPLMLALAATAHAQRATITEVSGTVTRGVITVNATPADVYALITSYAAWRSFLSDVVWARIEHGGRHDATVRMKTRSLGREATVRFDNVPDRAIRFTLIDGPPGARARGQYVLVPVDGGRRTRVEAELYMDVVGFADLFISGAKIRRMRRAKLSADLEDAARWLQQHVVAGPATQR